MQLEEPAPAKINLALHVRGKLPDGRHRLETVFAFCTDGDRVAASPAEEISLQVKGPFAGELGDPDDNLALRAARALREDAGVSRGASLVLTKNLPVASGIGGGWSRTAPTARCQTSGGRSMRLWVMSHSSSMPQSSSTGPARNACSSAERRAWG